MPRTTLLKLAALFGGVALGLVAAEGVVRGLGLGPVLVVAEGRYRLSSNPRIAYEPLPNLVYQGDTLHFYDYRGASNALGYRDREHRLAKTASTYRIAVLGDSIAAGQRVARYEDTFPAVLEELLTVRGLPSEVLNFGVSGYNTEQEVETLVERGLRFEPDLVLVAYCLNDRGRCDGDILKTLVAKAGGADPVVGQRWLLTQSRLARLAWYQLRGRRQQRPLEYAALAEDTVAASFVRLARLAQEHGFAVMVAVFPDLDDLRSYYFAAEHRFVAELSARNGFYHLDLLEPLRVGQREVRADRYHPNELGHRVAGRAMASFILERVVER